MFTLLKKEGDFRRYFSSVFFSYIGHFVSAMGFVFVAYDLTESNTLTTAIVIAEVLPFLLLGQVGGALSDVLPKVKIMISIDILRAILLILTFTLYVFGLLNFGLLLVFAFLNQLGGVFFNPASRTMVPSLVKKEQLTSANAVISVGQNISSILAPVITAALIGLGGIHWFFLIDALTFILSAFLLSKIKHQVEHKITLPVLKDAVSQVPSRLKLFINYLLKEKQIRWLFASTFFVVFFSTWVWQLGVLMVLGIDENSSRQTYSYLMALYAVSSIAASFLIPRLTANLNRSWYALGVICWGIGLLMFVLPAELWFYCIAVSIVGIGFAFTSQSRVYILQTQLPKKLMGQGFSFSAVLLYGANFLSLGIFAFVEKLAGMSLTFMIAAIPIILAGLYLALPEGTKRTTEIEPNSEINS